MSTEDTIYSGEKTRPQYERSDKHRRGRRERQCSVRMVAETCGPKFPIDEMISRDAYHVYAHVTAHVHERTVYVATRNCSDDENQKLFDNLSNG
jgi:hypothetical protein